MIHLSFFVRKLSCAIAGSSVNYCRWHDFSISGFACFVQEEVDKSALKLCAFTFIYGETCTCDSYTQVEVYLIIFLSQFPVGECIFRKFSFHTSHFFHYVIFSAYTFGYTVVRNVGDGIKYILHICCSLCHSGV